MPGGALHVFFGPRGILLGSYPLCIAFAQVVQQAWIVFEGLATAGRQEGGADVSTAELRASTAQMKTATAIRTVCPFIPGSCDIAIF